jgi:hypothetical protein
LKWGEREYTIPPNRVLQAIAKVEDHVTLVELHTYGLNNTAPLAKLSMAFGALLRHAGADVSDDQVYTAMFKSGEMQKNMVNAVQTMLMLMIPPEHLLRKEDTSVGKSTAAVATRSLKKRTK